MHWEAEGGRKEGIEKYRYDEEVGRCYRGQDVAVRTCKLLGKRMWAAGRRARIE